MTSPYAVPALLGVCISVGVGVGLLKDGGKEKGPIESPFHPVFSSPSDNRESPVQPAGESSAVLEKTSASVTNRMPSRRDTASRTAKQWGNERMASFIQKQNEQWIYLRNEYGQLIVQEDGSKSLSPLGKRYLTLTNQAGAERFALLERHDYAMEQLEKELQTLSASTPDRKPFVTNRRDNRFYPHIANQKVMVIANGEGCQLLAQTILHANKVQEVPSDEAKLALVVVRSHGSSDMLFNYPLAKRLLTDARHHLNDSGAFGHIHVHHLSRKKTGRTTEVRAIQLFHEKLNWSDFEVGQ